jgi:hypothetical protein
VGDCAQTYGVAAPVSAGSCWGKPGVPPAYGFPNDFRTGVNSSGRAAALKCGVMTKFIR